jgi:hypothetical protein
MAVPMAVPMAIAEWVAIATVSIAGKSQRYAGHA